MPLTAPMQAPPTALQLNSDAASSMTQGLEEMAHPLVEQLVRRIAAGELTSEQAFTEAQNHVNQAKQPQATLGTPGAAPTTVPAAPAPAPAAPPAAAAPAQPAPQQASLAPQQPMAQPVRQAPSLAPEIAGPPPIQQPMPPAAPVAAPVNNGQQPEPMANANNAAPGPSFASNLNAGRNQIKGSLENTQAAPERQTYPAGGAENTGANAENTAPAAPATGYAAARNAIMNLGPRMRNKDVAVFMDAFVKGGKPALEAVKEAGRNNRATESNRIKSRAVDVRGQRVNDQWEVETGRLALDKQREADKLAMNLEQMETARQKLRDASLRFAANREDKVALLDMKNAHDEMQTYIKAATQLGASIMAEAPTTHFLIEEARGRAGEAAKNYEAIRNFTVATQSSPDAPAPNRVGGDVPKMGTAGEAAQKVTGKKIGPQGKRSEVKKLPPATGQVPGPSDEVKVKRKSDGLLGTIPRSEFNSAEYEMVK